MLRLPGETASRHYKDLIADADVTGMLSAALQGERPATREVRIAHSRDRTFVATVARIGDSADGNAVGNAADSNAAGDSAGGGAVLVLHDVTELRKADQIRRDFVANVSHELRTPLTAIRGYVEALGDSATLSDEERARFLDVISRHTFRMERLVRDLLKLARLDAGQEPIEHWAVPLEDIVRAVEAEMADALAGKRQRLSGRFPIGATHVSGDPGKLHDVFRNLVENASNYGPGDSTIDVESHADDSWIHVTVADRGPGIAAEDLPRVFERFFRADRSRARDSGGTGLGLAIVRHLVELHGGNVSAAARDGGGTIVTVTLPNRAAQ
jgi:two-component system phosphate regulon sensor histidine kinase PhoR